MEDCDCDCSQPSNHKDLNTRCATPPCLFIRANRAKHYFPGLNFTPRPEPSRRDCKEWESWRKEYDEWESIQCPCGKGYFCRGHGEWVPGTDVTSGLVPPKDQQHKDQCPEWHYEKDPESREKGDRRSSSSKHDHKSKSKSKSERSQKESRLSEPSTKHRRTSRTAEKGKHAKPFELKINADDKSAPGSAQDEVSVQQIQQGLDGPEYWDEHPTGHPEDYDGVDDDYYGYSDPYEAHTDATQVVHTENDVPSDLTHRMASMQVSSYEEPSYSEDHEALEGQQERPTSYAGPAYSQAYDMADGPIQQPLGWDDYYSDYPPDEGADDWPGVTYGEGSKDLATVGGAAAKEEKKKKKSRDKGKSRHK